MKYSFGLDVGSTTVKLVVLDENSNVLHSVYQRHYSDVKKTVGEVMEQAFTIFGDIPMTIMVTGSGGMFIEKYLGIKHIQEVVAGTTAINRFIPQTDVAIELGGEDSKITYLSGNIEQRMNSICAGGTGAFIDQMASLLETDASGLNEMAKRYQKIYPIASRCGVFAKTDIQALVNQGASKEDIAASVFQSVVNQTISNLACGRPIRGHVAFLGGPLHFLDQLRARFIETLGLDDETTVIPDNSQIFVAIGAALASEEEPQIQYQSLINQMRQDVEIHVDESQVIEPLFTSQEELDEFIKSHETRDLEERPLEECTGNLYIGMDAGSTTSKVVVLDDDNHLVYQRYQNNKGNPLHVITETLKEIYTKKHPDARIASTGITGYGEEFMKHALQIDTGEVETIAHFTAAKYFMEDVDFILDIGGQDMKSMKIADGMIESILLNEACSSGCGSFIETFAKSLNMTVSEFQQEALLAENPVDLGSRCTVFMNSKVKQAQKEGATVGDIAAGLSYSVIKNAIQKVIKVRDPKKLGKNIVVQGGTFYGNAILRSFEKITGRTAIRPKIAGLMGAFGMALIAKENAPEKSRLLPLAQLEDFTYNQVSVNCGKCTNQCTLTINTFPNGEKFITGNRCERGAGIVAENADLPNLYNYKLKRLFEYYEPLKEKATRGQVGIPRVLNMYENYPFWHTFFTKLDYDVVLSGPSSRLMYEKGLASITSETACYPAKLVHGHIEDLVEKDVHMIFYPCVFYENQEYESAHNHLNCPVVAGYPEVIRNNVDSIKEKNIDLRTPFISFQDKKKLAKRLSDELKDILPNEKEIRDAVDAAWEALETYRQDVRKEGRRALQWLKDNDKKGIVLAGRPYHIDPEINHGIPGVINSLGWAVLSEDSIGGMEDVDDLRVLDQWVYHSRVYRAAETVGQTDELELVQLNSFGCGLDAVVTDQVNEILADHDKIYTVLKIDEVNNLGSAKIRLRSLTQALEKRERQFHRVSEGYSKVSFTKEMAKDYTILVPQMAPDHFEILKAALLSEGFNIEFLTDIGRDVQNEGLKYVNNDACYPSITVVGQLLHAVNSGKYDTDKIALLMTQTGGACRASNYVGFIRKAVTEAGHPQIPVIALSAQGIETSPGFKLTLPVLKKAVLSLIYGDLIARISNATRPYEKNKGEVNRVKAQWMELLKNDITGHSKRKFTQNVHDMIRDFEAIELLDIQKPRVGIVGEILVKYLPEANNHLLDTLEEEGAEVLVPDLIDFFMYSLRNATHKNTLLSKGKKGKLGADLAIKYIEYYRSIVRNALDNSKFEAPLKIETLEDYAQEFVSLGNQYGEGWLLTAEMVELIHQGAGNIVCVQPFGCLPNHITGKGVIKAVRESYPTANIIPIDYDPGASEVNQVNRIKLMLAAAREQMKKKEAVIETKRKEKTNESGQKKRTH